MQKEYAKTSIILPPELWKLAKREAIERNMTLSNFLEVTLRKELKADLGGQPRVIQKPRVINEGKSE